MNEKIEQANVEKGSQYQLAALGLILGSAVGFAIGGPVAAGAGAGIGLVLGAAIDANRKKPGN